MRVPTLPSFTDRRNPYFRGGRLISISGQMRIHKKSSHKMTAYFSDLKQRPLSISSNHVESFSKKNFKKVADEFDELKKSTCPLIAVLRFDNNDTTFAEINDVQFVIRNGVPALKLDFVLLESKGAFAIAATSFNNLNNGDYEDVSILCWPYDLGLC